VVSSKSLCLSIFVAVDKKCSLDIIFNVNEKNIFNRTVEGFNEYKLLTKWQKIEIRSNSSGKGELFLFRKRLDGQKTGYWAIHIIRFCPDNIGNIKIEDQKI
jgi:imidazole glycerol phosphate synthase subunit HisF